MKMSRISEKILSSFLVLLLAFSVTLMVFAEASAGGDRDTSWVPSAGSYMVGNSLVEFHSDSGYSYQGPYTIVDGFNLMQLGNPDFVWYGEYEFISTDGGTTWNMLPSVRALSEITAGQQYLISFDTSGTPLEGLTIDKQVTIVTGPDKPLAHIEYSISSTTPIESLLLYYAIDYCDEETTGDETDDVYDLAGTEVLTAQWFTGVHGLYVDTLGSGFGIIKTDYLADYYAGSWDDALYHIWGTGYDIHHDDDGIGVKIDFGAIAANETLHKSLYIGIYTAEEPPVGVHDVEAVSQTVVENEVLPGTLVDITVTVRNNGDFTESFDVTCSYDSVEIGTDRVENLAPGASTTVIFTWDTTGVPLNGYAISAHADSGMEIVEVDEDNNWCDMPLPIFVIPEVPLGTVMAILSMLIALVGFVGFKRFQPKLRLK